MQRDNTQDDRFSAELYSLKQKSRDELYELLQQKSLVEIYDLFYADMILPPVETDEPVAEWGESSEILKSLLIRLSEFDVSEELVDFVMSADISRSGSWLITDGERFLQLAAAANYYLNNYPEAAKLAGILADAYTINTRVEKDNFRGRYASIAAFACENMNDHEQAAHYFNQCVCCWCEFNQWQEVKDYANAYLQDRDALLEFYKVNMPALARLSLVKCSSQVLACCKSNPEEKLQQLHECFRAVSGAERQLEEHHGMLMLASVVIQSLDANFFKKLSADDLSLLMDIDELAVKYRRDSGLGRVLAQYEEHISLEAKMRLILKKRLGEGASRSDLPATKKDKSKFANVDIFFSPDKAKVIKTTIVNRSIKEHQAEWAKRQTDVMQEMRTRFNK